VCLANDANCLALSEATDGAAPARKWCSPPSWAPAPVAGIAVHGRVLQGPNGLAGEWGHNPLPWAEPGEDPGPGPATAAARLRRDLVSGPGLARDHAARHGQAGRRPPSPDAPQAATPPATPRWTATRSGWRARWPR
jgi:fructokinase